MEDHNATQQFDLKQLLDVPTIESNGVALPNGTHIGNFVIEKMLGVGGFGIVYLAIQDVVGRKVAIKEFFPSAMVDRLAGQTVKLRATGDLSLFDSGMSSFVKEATILSSLSHPSLVQVLHFWQENGTAYMVMPYYEGQALVDKLKDKEFIATASFIQKLLDGLLPALEYLHQQNIYHRDISPDNVIILKNGNPMLLDFGAARQIVEEGMNVTAMVKPSYAPIEQYDKAAKQGAYTDIYALSATLYHLITKKQPQASVTRNLNNYMTLLSSDDALLASYPRGLLKAIDAGLQIMPNARPQTIVDWRNILLEPLVQEETPIIAAQTQSSDFYPSTQNEDITVSKEEDIVVMRPVDNKNKHRVGIISVFVVLVVGVSAYFLLNKTDTQGKAVNHVNTINAVNLDSTAYEQTIKQYEDVNGLVSNIEINNLNEELLRLDKQIKTAQSPQTIFEYRKNKLVIEQKRALLTYIKTSFLKENKMDWDKAQKQIHELNALKNANKMTEAVQLLAVLSPILSDMNARLMQSKAQAESKNQILLQKMNGKWALNACKTDASNWQVTNNVVSVSMGDKQLAAEEIRAIINNIVITTPQSISHYPKNINELFFEYQVNDTSLIIKHLSDKQTLKRCL